MLEVDPQSAGRIRHAWGTITLTGDNDIADLATLQQISTKTLNKRYDDQRKKLERTKPLELATWLLQNWNIPRAKRLHTFDARLALEDLIDRTNADLPSFSEEDQKKIKALLQTRDMVNRELPEAKEDVTRLQQLDYLKTYRALHRGPYTMLYSSRQEREADQKMQRLIHAYAGFHYWFALHGHPLRQPERRMVVVLAEDANRFKELHAMFDTMPLHSDGFYSSLDNVAVLSPSRVDQLYEQFSTFSRDVERNMTGIDFRSVADRDPPKPGKNQPAPNANRIAYAQALVLALRAAQEEGETVTLMQESLEQLLRASGVVSRHILLPQAVKRGLIDFFAPTKSNSEIDLPTLWSGIGSPHWIYLPVFGKLAKVGEKGAKVNFDETGKEAAEIEVGKLSIRDILADRSFYQIEKAGEKSQPWYELRARAEAWALMYYLAEKHLDKLMAFLEELNQLPRDMELSQEAVEAAFARAFGLTKGPSDHSLDLAKLTAMEEDWKSTMASVNLETSNKK